MLTRLVADVMPGGCLFRRLLVCAAALLGMLGLVSCGGGTSGQPDPDRGGVASQNSPGSARKALAADAASVDLFTANGWYWNPAEGGSGFMFEAQGNRAFVGFFLYEALTGKPIWYAADGGFTAEADGSFRFAGELRVYAQGQAATALSYRTPTSQSVGAVSIVFRGNTATAVLPGGRRMAAMRFDIGGAGYNFDSPLPGRRYQPEVGWYFNPAEGGRGYAIEVQNDRLFMAVFHYNEDGSPTWQVLDGNLAAGSVTGPFQMFSGGQGLDTAYRSPTRFDLGSFSLSFRNPCAGQVQLAGMPPVSVRRFVIGGGTRPPGSECRSLTQGVVTHPEGLQRSGVVMEPGDSVFGRIGVPGVLSTYGYQLQGGVAYTMTLAGAAAGAGTLANPVLGLHDANLSRVATSGSGPASLSFTPFVAGTYYLSVQASGNETGSFVLSVSGSDAGLAPWRLQGASYYEGSIGGSLSGRDSGALALRIDPVGRITGSLVLASSPRVTRDVLGLLSPGGSLSLSAATEAGNLALAGFVFPGGVVQASWRDALGSGGLFRGTWTQAVGVVNTAPTARAGPAQAVQVGDTVRLDGSLSTDPEGDALSFEWTLLSQPIGSTIALAQATSPKASFVPDLAGTYLVALAVSDGRLASTQSLVVINAAAAPSVTVLAVGDIAQCQGLPPAQSAAAKTAALIARQPADWPLLLLGDLVYNSGTLAEYRGCYDPTYGPFLARSFPAPGNHDYGVAGGADYYTYFGARAGVPGRGYYSLDLGSWHIVSLNSNVPMTRGSDQDNWLRADLAAQPGRKCTLAYWHHPRYSSSNGHGDDPRSSDAWSTLLEYGADVVLVGHDHTYERFAPQNAQSQADPLRGIRQFVVGTGGAGLYGFAAARPNSEVRGQGSFGVLKLVLDDGRYAWEFLPAEGSTLSDSGSAACVK